MSVSGDSHQTKPELYKGQRNEQTRCSIENSPAVHGTEHRLCKLIKCALRKAVTPDLGYGGKSQHHRTLRLQEASGPPDQSKVNTEFKRGLSRLCPARSWKPPRVETAQPLWARPALTEKYVVLSHTETSSSNLQPLPSSSCNIHQKRAWLCPSVSSW